MKRILIILIIMIAGLSTVSAQYSDPGLARLDYLRHEVISEVVVITYNINYAGMTELRIFDENAEMVYRDQRVNRPGENTFRLRASAFKPGVNYTIRFNYKSTQIEKVIHLP